MRPYPEPRPQEFSLSDNESVFWSPNHEPRLPAMALVKIHGSRDLDRRRTLGATVTGAWQARLSPSDRSRLELGVRFECESTLPAFGVPRRHELPIRAITSCGPTEGGERPQWFPNGL